MRVSRRLNTNASVSSGATAGFSSNVRVRVCWLVFVTGITVFVSEPAGAMAAEDSPDLPDSLAARRERIEEMPQPERDRLLRNQERFEHLSSAEQSRLRTLHAELSHDPEAEQLREVMRRYQDWLKTLSASQRAELPKLSSAERIERIKKWQADEHKRARRRLTLADVQALLAWREKQVLATLPDAERQRYEAIQNPRERRAQMRELYEDPKSHVQLRQASPEELEDLKTRLSSEGRQVLEEAQTGGRDQVRRLLFFWDVQSRGGYDELRMLDVKQEDLTKYFDTLNDRDRDELLALPPDEMWQKLAHRYKREKISSNFSGRRPGGGSGSFRGNRRSDADDQSPGRGRGGARSPQGESSEKRPGGK